MIFEGECEFCGHENLVATSPIGYYYKDCWDMILGMAENAIFELDGNEELSDEEFLKIIEETP